MIIIGVDFKKHVDLMYTLCAGVIEEDGEIGRMIAAKYPES
jgi:hypothetical protein